MGKENKEEIIFPNKRKWRTEDPHPSGDDGSV